jgi:large subunit ribosomal protein L23
VNKLQIKEAVEMAWPDVEVMKVRVANMPAKRSRRWRRMAVRRPGYKKAIVTLAPGGSIDLFEGV